LGCGGQKFCFLSIFLNTRAVLVWYSHPLSHHFHWSLGSLAVIKYEYPLNERVRTFLRLETLFHKFGHFAQVDGPLEHHVALLTLFEIIDVAGRADLKIDLVQELERQRQVMLGFRNNPKISEQALSGMLCEIEEVSSALLNMIGKIGQYVRDNEWLTSIRNRVSIPGGATGFDLPAYHYWQHQSFALRKDELESWIEPVLPIRDAITILLRLLRSSGHPENHLGMQGAFQMMMNSRMAQMVRVRVRTEDPLVPEMSANKYALNIRFMSPETLERPVQVNRDVPFELTFCNLQSA
jgi:cell division protein ZapD